MKKILNIVGIVLILPTIFISAANAETIYHYGDGTSGTTPPTPAQAAIGGFAVVNPETGVVHGVITGSIESFGGNNRIIGHEYMGCPAGCLIVQQSTSDQNSNVSGIRSELNRDVTYIENRNVFQVAESNTKQTETVIESTSNTSSIETEVSISRSIRYYEFGVQDLIQNNGQFKLIEIEPPINTSAVVSTKTKNFFCEESALLCSSRISNSSTTLTEEVIAFDKRKTSEQFEAQVVTESKTKIREQISLILSMLERWIIK